MPQTTSRTPPPIDAELRAIANVISHPELRVVDRRLGIFRHTETQS